MITWSRPNATWIFFLSPGSSKMLKPISIEIALSNYADLPHIKKKHLFSTASSESSTNCSDL
jgi:hypothetical protein